jgi:D-alanyl-D-alanine carboxypeptidase (penicillin-binding protein 5/6)
MTSDARRTVATRTVATRTVATRTVAVLTSITAITGLTVLGSFAGPAASAVRPTRLDVGGPQLASHGIIANYPSRNAIRLPRVPASAYVIADADTGQILAAKDPHGLFPPASTLKLLTAITMIPRLDPAAMVVATRRAASVVPNVVGLIPGRKYKVADLFRALLLISANDAAVSLIQASGSFDRGIALMNAQAHQLQAYDVVARQPNGLPAPGQVVSAYDLALIARRALSMPAFMKYDSTLAARFPVTRRKRVALVNQNYLLTQYRGGIGGKIGWTVRAEATYVGLARRHGVTLIVTILHCTPLTEIHSAEHLLSWGFAMVGKVRPVGVLVPPLATGRPSHGRTPAGRHGLAAAGSAQASGLHGARASVAVGAALTAGVCVALLGAMAWFRRRISPGRRPFG